MTDDRNNNCSICLESLNRDDAPVLTMGHYGYPRYICKDCEALIETALKSHEVSEAEAAIAKLGETVGNNSADDNAVLEAMEDIFKSATERVQAIKDGTYDFSLDEEDESEGLEEIPEELLETEEDKKATEREEEVNRKFNKVMDVVTALVFAAAAAVMIFYFIK